MKINRFFALLLLAGCTVEDPNFVPQFSIDPRVQPYVDKFYQEATARGLDLQKENLIMKIVDIDPDEYCGLCTSPRRGSGQIEIEINFNAECWASEPAQNKEALVFHELGHCLLDRNHKNKHFSDGSPKSIMTSHIEDQYTPCEYDIDGRNGEGCNKTNRRTYYIDELFDPSKDTNPFWLQ